MNSLMMLIILVPFIYVVNMTQSVAAQSAATRRARNAGQLNVMFKVPIEQIREEQKKAFESYPVGRYRLDFAMGYDALKHPRSESNEWIKVCQEGHCAAHQFKEYLSGLEEVFPHGRYRFSIRGDRLLASSLNEPQPPETAISVMDMDRRLYNAAHHIFIGETDYALVYEDGNLMPASISLIRQSDPKSFRVTSVSREELRHIVYFMLRDGIFYGMSLSSDNLVFYSKKETASR